jgi:hypothetical protein
MKANAGHGHVTPRPDGIRARCGGPGICDVCSRELAISRRTLGDITPSADAMNQQRVERPLPVAEPVEMQASRYRMGVSALHVANDHFRSAGKGMWSICRASDSGAIAIVAHAPTPEAQRDLEDTFRDIVASWTGNR